MWKYLNIYKSPIYISIAAGDRCPALPHLHNGRNIKVATSGGSAYHFKCNKVQWLLYL